MPPEKISPGEAAKRAGVSTATLRRWVKAGVVSLEGGEWTETSAAQARVVARMRKRGYSLEEVREAAAEGRLAFGYAETLLAMPEERFALEEAAMLAGLEPGLVQRVLKLLGTPAGLEATLGPEDVEALRHFSAVLDSGFPLVAVLQMIRVYAQALRRIAETEVRLFHIHVHEPLMRDGVEPLAIAEQMGNLATEMLPIATPLMEYMHRRYLRFYMDQDIIGHMEVETERPRRGLVRVSSAFCFVDLTGFTRYTEEEGDEEALDLVERFVETVEATLPEGASIVKTIGDEVMIVSPDVGTLTEWAVGFLGLFQQRPQPRVGIHYGAAVYRDADYFGHDVNLAHRVVNRALGGEVMVTQRAREASGESEYLEYEPIGEVDLKGIPEPIELLVARAAEPDE